MNLVEHAKKELEVSGLFDKDSDYGGMVGKAVLELIEVFAKQGHSGMSASMVRSIFSKLSDYKPLIPLTLKDDEWCEVSNGTFQNKRNSAVFKEGKDGKAYYIDAYYKKTQNNTTWNGSLDLPDGRRVGRCYIKNTSRMPIICINVIETEVAKDDWEMVVVKDKQLDKLREFYDFELLNKEE